MRNLLRFLAVAGPGLIVMEADNDAGGVLSYMQAGAQYGWVLVPVLLLLLPITYFVQEMAARLGISEGDGHMTLIFRRFGQSWGRFALADLLILNLLTLLTEFSAIASVSNAYGIPKIIGVSAVTALSFLILISKKYRVWEIIMVVFCLLDISWFLWVVFHLPIHATANTGIIAGPWATIMALIGTTIAPWQIFFQQRCVVDKGLITFGEMKLERMDTLLSAGYTILAAIAMMAAGVYYSHNFTDPSETGSIFLSLLWINAAFLGTVCVSLSSAWSWTEALEVPGAITHPTWKFLSVYLVCIVLAGGYVCIPSAPLDWTIIAVQILSAIMLPVSIGFMLVLLSRVEKPFHNSRLRSSAGWAIVALLTACTVWGFF